MNETHGGKPQPPPMYDWFIMGVSGSTARSLNEVIIFYNMRYDLPPVWVASRCEQSVCEAND